MPATSAAAATDECGSSVLDSNSFQVLDMNAVEDATSKLQELGADVRVRTYDIEGTSFLDAKFDELVQACPDWHFDTVDGVVIKDNLLVFMVSPDRTLFAYGPTWANEISVQDAGDIQGLMYDQTVDTAAILVAEEAALDQIDGLNLVDPVVWGSALIVLIGLCVMLALLRRAKATAKQQAQAARQAVKTLIDQLLIDKDDPAVGLKGLDIEVMNLDLDPVNRDELAQQVKEADLALMALLEHDNALSRDNDLDLEQGHSKAEYAHIATVYNGLLAEATQAKQQFTEARTAYDTLSKQIVDAPIQLAALETEAKQLDALRDRLVQSGYQPTEPIKLDEATSLLVSASSLIDNKHPGNALDELEKAKELLAAIRLQLTELTTKADELLLSIQSAEVEVGEMQGEQDAHQASLRGLRQQVETAYAEFQGDSPDYLAFSTSLKDAGTSLESVRATARTEHDRLVDIQREAAQAAETRRQRAQRRRAERQQDYPAIQGSGSTPRITLPSVTSRRSGGTGFSLPRSRSSSATRSSTSTSRRSTSTSRSSGGRSSSGSGGKASGGRRK